MSEFAARRDDARRFTVTGPGGAPIATLQPNDWETEFFGRSMGGLVLTGEEADALTPDQWRRVVSLVAEEADAYDLVQLHLDVRHLPLVPAVEAAGFRLVDTRITFLARIDDEDTLRRDPPFGTVRLAAPEDLAGLFDLTHRCLTLDPVLISRYKHPDYFSPADTRRWFEAWVANAVASPDAMTAVWQAGDRPLGYLAYYRQGTREGLPVWATGLAAVEPEWRGHKAQLFLQSHLYRRMGPYPVWQKSITQLSNLPTLHNGFASGKRAVSVELTFFRSSVR